MMGTLDDLSPQAAPALRSFSGIEQFKVVISRTVSSRLLKNLIGAVELNSSALPLHADLARPTLFLPIE